MGKIAILTRGLWRLKREVGALSGLHPVRWQPWRKSELDAVAGWGHKMTADRARRLANRLGVPYLAFEDGPLRSVKPGPAQPPVSLVMDRNGIYYRADSASDLIALAGSPDWFTSSVADLAESAIASFRRLRLSKYNAGSERSRQELGIS